MLKTLELEPLKTRATNYFQSLFEHVVPDQKVNIGNFLRESEERQKQILDSTQIVITEEEFKHAKRWLALAYITGGEHFIDENGVEINHKSIYQNQGILPADIKIEGTNLKEQINSVTQHITADHVKKLYKRLVKNRPKYFYSEIDITDPERNCGDRLHVKLANYISYAEMDFCSSLLQVSGEVNFVNKGNRRNSGLIGIEGEYQKQGRISAIVGARFEIDNGMEGLNLCPNNYKLQKDDHNKSVATKEKADFGKIKSVKKEFVEGYKLIWDEFYKEQNSGADGSGVEIEKLTQRLYISYKKFFADAIKDTEEDKDGKRAHIRVVGIGDGAWAGHLVGKDKVGEAIGSAIAKVLKELPQDKKDLISDIEFCDHGGANYENGFNKSGGKEVANEIKVTNNKEAPFSDKLADGKKLYVCFAWDGGSYVGNEYWHSPPFMFEFSGDPAAAACSSIPISMNPELNDKFLDRIKVVKSKGCEIVDIDDASLNVDAKFHETEVAKKTPSVAPPAGGGALGTLRRMLPWNTPPVAEVVAPNKKNQLENLETLKTIFGVANVVSIEEEGNFFIKYATRKEAEVFSQELFNREGNYKITGTGGDKKHVNFQYKDSEDIESQHFLDKIDENVRFFGIILTPENIKKIKDFEDKQVKKIQEVVAERSKKIKFLEKTFPMKSYKKSFQVLFQEGKNDYYLYLADVASDTEDARAEALKKAESLSDKFKTCGIAGGKGDKKVVVPMDRDGGIIYSNGAYDYKSSRIQRFAIILTDQNVCDMEKNHDQFKEIIAEINLSAVAPPPPPPPAPAREVAPPAPDLAPPPAQTPAPPPAPTPTQQAVAGVLFGGLGFGGTLLCASALGFGIVSAPVIGVAVGVGLATAGVAIATVALAKPVGESINEWLQKKEKPTEVREFEEGGR